MGNGVELYLGRVVSSEGVFFFLFLDKLKDPLSCGSRRLQHVHHVSDCLDRVVEVADIQQECLDVADGYHVVESQVSAEYAHSDVAQVADKSCKRHHQAGEELRFPRGRAELFVDLVELFGSLFLAAESFDDRVACVHLFDVTVYFTEEALLVTEIPL